MQFILFYQNSGSVHDTIDGRGTPEFRNHKPQQGNVYSL